MCFDSLIMRFVKEINIIYVPFDAIQYTTLITIVTFKTNTNT
jgi:hypothetical protein